MDDRLSVALVAFFVGYFSAELTKWLVRREHRADMARLDALYTTALSKLGNTQAFGTPTPLGGDVEEREPEPETRAARQIDQEVLERGMDAMRREYLAIGVTMSDDELEAEVRLIMRGETPRVPRDLAPFVRD